MIQSTSANHAKAYFSEALQKSDYYINDQELNGRVQGRIAERLDLKGPATKDIFFALCENINPHTGKTLTQRTKQERRIGYDINFHCPKSVSILHALSKDDHILKSFEASVQETMLDIETDSKTRVRKKGNYADRETGELIWADFTHQTSRPVEGEAPDPHLHSHCFVFNVTWDEVEKQFKAGQFGEIKRDMPYYQARFHKRLSDRMMKLGYEIRQTDKSFEVEGVPQMVIDLFSKRTDEIGRIAKEKGIHDAKKKSELGARTRAKKQKSLGMEELRQTWKEQIRALPEIEEESKKAVRFALKKEQNHATAKNCVDYAVKHSFERYSVMQDRRILETAFRHGLGNAGIGVDDIEKTFKADEKIIHVKDRYKTLCTTKEILSEEQRMVSFAREGQNKFVPLYRYFPEMKAKGEQANAIKNLLKSPHRVNILRGAAGTGKTQLMREAVDLIENVNKKVCVIAPTSDASRGVLSNEGFTKADTVAKFLLDKKMQDSIKEQVLWVDEAGLLGTQDMSKLLEIATRQKARIILSGDTRQHSSVVRGDALRILNTVAKIKTAELNEIKRQKTEYFRSAVSDLSVGNIKNGFEKLDEMKFIKTVKPLAPNDDLVQDYVAAMKKGKSALIVSPTHKQGDEVTIAVRNKLRQSGMIGKKEINHWQLKGLNFTEAQKGDWRNFKMGQVVQFNQNADSLKRGSKWVVADVTNNAVWIRNTAGKQKELPNKKAKSFEVYEQSIIKLSRGDKIRVTRNGFDMNEKRLNNGQVLDVMAVSIKGKVIVRNTKSKVSYALDQEFPHISHAHCITSHASQGKTVDEVFISQPSGTFAATDAKQFYVSVSRARDKATVYTDDKVALLEYASELGERKSALELIGQQRMHQEIVVQRERLQDRPSKDRFSHDKPKYSPIPKERDYEPGF